MWFHVVVYKQFDGEEFRKIFDIWEDGCGFLNGTTKSIVMDHSFGAMMKHPNTETNLKHKCPYVGEIYIKSGNISLDSFPYQRLMPTGNYRVESISTLTKDGPWLSRGNTYFSVSD